MKLESTGDGGVTIELEETDSLDVIYKGKIHSFNGVLHPNKVVTLVRCRHCYQYVEENAIGHNKWCIDCREEKT